MLCSIQLATIHNFYAFLVLHNCHQCYNIQHVGSYCCCCYNYCCAFVQSNIPSYNPSFISFSTSIHIVWRIFLALPSYGFRFRYIVKALLCLYKEKRVFFAPCSLLSSWNYSLHTSSHFLLHCRRHHSHRYLTIYN